MTNHPGRQHGDEEPSAADELAAEVPAVAEMASEMTAPPQVPPGFSPNGHSPSAQALQAVAAAFQQLPQMLFQAVGQALQQVPVAVRQMRCAQCVLDHRKWGALHSADIAKAETAYSAAVAEMQQRAPEDRVPLDGLGFLPERLRPGAPQGPPNLADGVVMVGGTLLCADCIPGAPGQPGQTQLLVAQGSLPDGTLAGFLRSLAA